MHRSEVEIEVEDQEWFLGAPPPEPLGEAEPDLYYFMLGDSVFGLIPWKVKPYSRRQLTKEERKANYRIPTGRRAVENVFGILVSRFRVRLEQRPNVVKDIVLTYVVLHKMLRIHQGGTNRAPTPANDIVALQNKQVVYVPDDNYRNPLKENKHQ